MLFRDLVDEYRSGSPSAMVRRFAHPITAANTPRIGATEPIWKPIKKTTAGSPIVVVELSLSLRGL